MADARFHSAADRNAHREEVLGHVRAWALAQPSRKACIDALDAAGVPCRARPAHRRSAGRPADPARGMIVEQDHPVLGRIRMPNLPFRFSDCDTSPRGVAPLMGQHNRGIATMLGYSETEIDAMIEDGVLYAEEAVGRLGAA